MNTGSEPTAPISYTPEGSPLSQVASTEIFTMQTTSNEPLVSVGSVPTFLNEKIPATSVWQGHSSSWSNIEEDIEKMREMKHEKIIRVGSLYTMLRKDSVTIFEEEIRLQYHLLLQSFDVVNIILGYVNENSFMNVLLTCKLFYTFMRQQEYFKLCHMLVKNLKREEIHFDNFPSPSFVAKQGHKIAAYFERVSNSAEQLPNHTFGVNMDHLIFLFFAEENWKKIQHAHRLRLNQLEQISLTVVEMMKCFVWKLSSFAFNSSNVHVRNFASQLLQFIKAAQKGKNIDQYLLECGEMYKKLRVVVAGYKSLVDLCYSQYHIYSNKSLISCKAYFFFVMPLLAPEFEILPQDFREDYEIALEAIKYNDKAFKFIGNSLQNNMGFVRKALIVNPKIFAYVPKKFYSNKSVVQTAVKANGVNLAFANTQMKTCDKIVREAVSSNGLALQYVPYRYQSEKDYVLSAVMQNGCALQYASPELRADEEIVKKAVQNDRNSLKYASFELQNSLYLWE